MSKRTIYMGTTGIDAARTAAEIQVELVKAKANSISNDYDAQGRISAMHFRINTPDGGELWYRLPVRVDAVWNVMKKHMSQNLGREQAERTAWRQILRWVQAQLALIEMNASSAFEVFLPYMVDGNGHKTLAETMAERHNVPLLPPGSK